MKKISAYLILCAFCFGHEDVYDFCAYFAENPNEYSIHPVLNNDLISKSFGANYTSGKEPYVHFKFDAPSDSLDSLMGGCAVLGGPPVFDFNFHLNDASRKLETHYGAHLNGKVESFDMTTKKKKTKFFKFKIKGECQNNLVVAEYCVDKKGKRLYKTKDLDYLPKFLFSGIENSLCNCKKYVEQVTTYIRNPKNMLLVLEDFITKGCDEYVLTDFIDVSDEYILNNSARQLLIENRAKIQIDSVTIDKKFDFVIKINGDCKY
ncbi:hypothetical protein [Fibrobacter sp. UWH3]|uniref:hypothetical protein n=2 Tax=Fibrobacter TaxID=832 RepID=UPI000B528162|nr:hypothetical protein [Fibrobacter sp. UWH3]MDO4947240.1 hypothetical protein [Fibrobacter sp.]OWV06451.1 hypothetical protein B7993_05875 [Fibrobacter sp. UWH3]